MYGSIKWIQYWGFVRFTPTETKKIHKDRSEVTARNKNDWKAKNFIALQLRDANIDKF